MPYGRYQEQARVNNIKGWGCGWKHNLCDAVVCSAFRRHIDAQLFWSISPSEHRPSLSLRLSACEKMREGRERAFKCVFATSSWKVGKKMRVGEGDLWRGRGASFNPAPASEMLLFANHNIVCLSVEVVLVVSSHSAFEKPWVCSLHGYTETFFFFNLISQQLFSMWWQYMRRGFKSDCPHFRTS